MAGNDIMGQGMSNDKGQDMSNDKQFNDKHFTIDAGSVKAALTAVGKDKMRPMLDCLHVKVGVSGSGDKRHADVTIEATDSYRLIQVHTSSECIGKDLEDAEFNVAGVKVQSAAKWVDFDLSGDGVTVRTLNGKTSEASLCHAYPTSTAVYRKMDGTFPNVGQLITYKEKAVTGVCVNPKYLGDVAKAAQALEAKSVQFMGATEHKLTGGKVSVGGVRWTMHGGDGICAEYIVMPVRDREWELMFAGGTNADREKDLLRQLEGEVAKKVKLGHELNDMRQKYEELKASKPIKAESDCDVCAAKANYENAKKQLADLQEKYDELLKTERKVTQQKDAATQELGRLKERLASKEPSPADVPVNGFDQLSVGIEDDGVTLTFDDPDGNLTGRIINGTTRQGRKLWFQYFNGDDAKRAKCLFVVGPKANQMRDLAKLLGVPVRWARDKRMGWRENPDYVRPDEAEKVA